MVVLKVLVFNSVLGAIDNAGMTETMVVFVVSCLC